MNGNKFFHNLHRDEAGITALETAIILIAFIVVASVFAFTILSAGTFSTERGKEAVYSGLAEVQSSMEVKGSLIATAGVTGTTTAEIDTVVFTIGNVVGGEPLDLNTAAPVMVINYVDSTQFDNDMTWTTEWIVSNDGDELLDKGELVEITVDLSGLTNVLSINTAFTLEMKPPKGAALTIQRTTPAYFDDVMDLH
ncbi:MAG: hypothetical protein KA314_26900 [Chloroflexi bacterium]|nr:hypothetical protein [Chloroflexota bacterium]MBP8059481.1 hypothetical protein [Chloroflexota bacterium]